MRDPETCPHTVEDARWVSGVDDWGEPYSHWEYTTRYTQVDISLGAFRCTQCGKVGYYTGSWRRHYENDEPCQGSDSPKAKTAEVRKALKKNPN